ncbi:MAG: DcaP family trimeric outer membrane transporter [Pseudomonadota bacterium]
MQPSEELAAEDLPVTNFRPPCAVVFSVVLLLPVPLWADTAADLAALKAQIDALAKIVEAQAARIDELESGQQTPDAPPADAADTEVRSAAARQPLGRFPDDAIVTAGDFDGSINIPGTEASVRLGGFVRAEGNYDFDSLGFQDTVSVRRIPLDGTDDDDTSQSRFHVRNSRMNLDYRRKTKFGELRTFVEWDFFGGGSEFINNYEFRLRNAAAGIGNFYFGQWWSHFDDVSTTPEGADFGGPLGVPVLRNPGVRWSQNVSDNWRVGLGVENPTGDLDGPDELLASDSVPDVSGFVRYSQPWGHVRLAGLVRRLESLDDEQFVLGANFTGRVALPYADRRDNISFQFQAGEGFTHYYSTFSGVGLNGVVDTDGTIEATGIVGGFLAFQHWWDARWRSTLQASFLELDSPAGSDTLAFDNGRYYSGNVFWTPIDGVTLGLDLIYAEQEVVSGAEGDGMRVHAIARFDF